MKTIVRLLTTEPPSATMLAARSLILCPAAGLLLFGAAVLLRNLVH